MQYVILGALALGALVGVGQLFVNVDPRQLVRALRFTLGGGLLALAAVLFFGRQWGVAVTLGALGIAVLTRGRIGPFDLGGGTRSEGGSSAVTSRWLYMQLDHASGDLAGTVREGRFRGRRLDDLDRANLEALRDDLGADADSLALLEVYL